MLYDCKLYKIFYTLKAMNISLEAKTTDTNNIHIQVRIRHRKLIIFDNIGNYRAEDAIVPYKYVNIL